MKTNSTVIILLILLYSAPVFGQECLTADTGFGLEKQVYASGLIHSPLALDTTRAYETFNRLKKVVLRKTLTTNDPTSWQHSGLGSMTCPAEKSVSGTGSVKLEFPSFTGKRAIGSPSDPDYATYGNCNVIYKANGENWEKYNRISFEVYPDCEGARIVNLYLIFENGSKTDKPGYNRQTGTHLVSLENKRWNQCFLDLGEYQRDEVKSIAFQAVLKGKDRTTGDVFNYYIDKIELQKVENQDAVSGWTPDKNKIVYSTTGYTVGSPKTAIVNIENATHPTAFQLVKAENGQTVFKGSIIQQKTTIGEFSIVDFTSFNTPGEYRIKVDNISTPPFRIGERIWENSLWRTLNFIFCQRCGYAVPGVHSTCHTDLCSTHNGKTISYAGGWHDAGDLSQQTLQTADVTYALLEAYNKLKSSNTPLAMRMLEEAEWGLEHILKNRYGDGYRASSVGLLIWQDGVFGTLDDISTVRVHNLAFDNFLYAGYEAYAALSIDHDPMLKEYLRRVAEEDFKFATEKFKKSGFGGFIHFYEHTYNTSESQYMATISWAASMLYKLTNNPEYAKAAAEYIQYTLDCQRTESLNDKDEAKGFFYRNKSRQSIVHYNHQSREQIYMQAMTLLCETQPNHPDYGKWAKSIRLYGNYLKGLMQYTAPYGMLPSGVYHTQEYRDSIGFNALHLFAPANAKELYTEQVTKGVQLDKEHYVKRFPVWFGIFNGNTAVHLSTGKAAALCGNFLNDKELLNIGREQLYWTVGKNPFGQSLIYGEGYNYPRMDSFSSGEITGEMPVGIRSLGNDDTPYWPPTTNACYKEVWVTSAGKWLSLIAEY